VAVAELLRTLPPGMGFPAQHQCCRFVHAVFNKVTGNDGKLYNGLVAFGLNWAKSLFFAADFFLA
jgi:hypothetical protein